MRNISGVAQAMRRLCARRPPGLCKVASFALALSLIWRSLMVAPEPYATLHYRARAAERALPRDIESFLQTWGTEVWAADARQIALFRKHLPEDLRDTVIARRAEEWILVAAPNGALMTCYQRRNAWRFITRKANARRARKPRHRRSRRR